MNRSLRSTLPFLVLLGLAAVAGASLNSLIIDLNLQAKDDPAGFNAKLSAQFGVSLPSVEAILGQVNSPADAFLVLQVGLLVDKPMGAVMKSYRAHKGKGWGDIAQELGVAPGSKAFHDLKEGRFTLSGDLDPRVKGKAKGKGQNKGKDK